MTTQTDLTRTRPVVPSGRWIVDPAHSNVEFGVKHMGIATVRGRFTAFDGTLVVTEDLAASKVSGKVMVASIDTNAPDRDAHLRSPDFFDVERYPEIGFESTRIEAVDDTSSRVFGNLTMHGVTREVKLEVVISGTDEDPWGNTRVGLEAVGAIMRSDFDMTFNQALGSSNMLVGDKVTIRLDISAIKES
jgi:polyisoprenoid-binding protein YceI